MTATRRPIVHTSNGKAECPKVCATCGQTIEPYSEFPTPSGVGFLCLTCYAESPEGQRIPSADEVVAMWGGPVR